MIFSATQQPEAARALGAADGRPVGATEIGREYARLSEEVDRLSSVAGELLERLYPVTMKVVEEAKKDPANAAPKPALSDLGDGLHSISMRVHSEANRLRAMIDRLAI